MTKVTSQKQSTQAHAVARMAILGNALKVMQATRTQNYSVVKVN